MNEAHDGAIGYACAYAPLPLFDAVGLPPYRLLPTGDWPDRAGGLLHDNLCPHVKRVLDRAMVGDLPRLSGMVFVNSCDAMRRLADAWIRTRPTDRAMLIDLPTVADEAALAFFADELRRAARTLTAWTGRAVEPAALHAAMDARDRQAEAAAALDERRRRGALSGGASRLQRLYNAVSTSAPDEVAELLAEAQAEPEAAAPLGSVPVYLFGNVLPDVEAFDLIESCGARVAADDLCTGSRLFKRYAGAAAEDAFARLARGLLSGPACARTFDAGDPGGLSADVLSGARACGAVGVVGHVMKFCDPYLARLPALRQTLREAGMPLLLLDGDCSMRSMGQQRTRIEAFVEMLR